LTAPRDDAPDPGTEGTDQQITFTTDSTPTDTVNATAFGVMWDRPLTTTRTCGGVDCWCHVGAAIPSPLTHEGELQRLASAIRRLEVAQGMLAL
jgi:hypothetical protein